MFKRFSDFFVGHIEIIISGLICLVCLWVLLMRVIISPNTVVYDNKRFSPSEIDNHIKKETVNLQMNFQAPARPREDYSKQLDVFLAQFSSPLANIPDFKMPVPQLRVSSVAVVKYSVPVLASVRDASAENIRSVAYIPIADISADKLYEDVAKEPNDLDLVTVEAKLNVAQIYDSFYAAYAGDKVPAEWRDPCLAVPVFAAVELQRQEKLPNGQWSDWKQVPRTKIDHMRSMLEIIENLDDLPRGGMRVRLLQFNRPDVRNNILQPMEYQIASAYEDWFPPSLHRKFLRLYADEKAAERREAFAREREERESATRIPREDPRRPTATPTPDRTTRTPARDTRKPIEPQPPVRTREVPQKDTVNSVYDELSQLRITPQTDIARTADLLIWGHDDTVVPGKTYRYRIRVGVFNPLAGTDSFFEDSLDYQDKVILWSGFSETASLEIPARLYFFPTGIQDTTSSVQIEVAKYEMGYWYSSNFLVRQGETIGKPKEQTPTNEEITKGLIIPSQVDYTTGAFMVDLVPVEDWEVGRSLKPRSYLDMFYSYDGTLINNIPVLQRNWPSEIQSRYTEIRALVRQPKEPLRPWGDTTRGRNRDFLPGTLGYLTDIPMPPNR